MRYDVDVKEIWTRTIFVESDKRLTRHQIIDKALKIIEEGVEIEDHFEYSTTMDTEVWTIRDKEGNFISK